MVIPNSRGDLAPLVQSVNTVTSGHPDHGIPDRTAAKEIATRISSPPSHDACPRGNEHDTATPGRGRAV